MTLWTTLVVMGVALVAAIFFGTSGSEDSAGDGKRLDTSPLNSPLDNSYALGASLLMDNDSPADGADSDHDSGPAHENSGDSGGGDSGGTGDSGGSGDSGGGDGGGGGGGFD